MTGKAQEAYSALSLAESKVYLSVKSAVLKAYELVPEAYRQKFRLWEKSAKQTHMEFASVLTTHFNRWCISLGVNTYADLCDLIVLEQFKDSVSSHIATYINEHKVKTASEAATLADEYVLTHRDDTYYWGESGRFRPASKWWDEGAGPRYGRPERAARSQVQFDPGNVCNYCGGHWKDECPVTSNTVEEFLKTPSEELLERCSREQLVKIADHFEMDVGDRRSKENMKRILRENLLEMGVLESKLHAFGAVVDTVGASVSTVAGVSPELTFEQRKELLLLQADIKRRRRKTFY